MMMPHAQVGSLGVSWLYHEQFLSVNDDIEEMRYSPGATCASVVDGRGFDCPVNSTAKDASSVSFHISLFWASN